MAMPRRPFKKGRESAALKGSPDTPCRAVHKVNMNTAAAIIQEESTFTLKQLVGMLDITERRAHTILTKKLNFSCMCSKCVPRLLTNEMKT